MRSTMAVDLRRFAPIREIVDENTLLDLGEGPLQTRIRNDWARRRGLVHRAQLGREGGILRGPEPFA